MTHASSFFRKPSDEFGEHIISFSILSLFLAIRNIVKKKKREKEKREEKGSLDSMKVANSLSVLLKR